MFIAFTISEFPKEVSERGRLDESYTAQEVRFSKVAFEAFVFSNLLLNSFSNASRMANVGEADVIFL